MQRRSHTYVKFQDIRRRSRTEENKESYYCLSLNACVSIQLQSKPSPTPSSLVHVRQSYTAIENKIKNFLLGIFLFHIDMCNVCACSCTRSFICLSIEEHFAQPNITT
ncbi:hypothetical protein ACKWTF_013557 [Chironomus riparius]